MNALHERFPSVKVEGVVTNPFFWATSAGYEFCANLGDGDVSGTLSASNNGMQGSGWTNTSGTTVSGSTADLLSAADEALPAVGQTGSGQLLASPRIFGSYDHALQASRFLGYFPTKLTAEFTALFNVLTTNETIAFLGLAGPAVVDASAAGSAGGITYNGANFVLVSDNATDAGAAADSNLHRFKIEVDATNTTWYIDGTSQGSITTEADIWPLSVTVVGGTNRIRISRLRVYYS